MANHSDVLAKLEVFDKCIQTVSKELTELKSLYESQRKKIMQDEYEFEVFTVYKRNTFNNVEAYIIITKETNDYFENKLGYRMNTIYDFYDNQSKKYLPQMTKFNRPILTEENKHMFYISDAKTEFSTSEFAYGFIDMCKKIFPDREYLIKDILFDAGHKKCGSGICTGGYAFDIVRAMGYFFKVQVRMPVPPPLVNLMDDE